MVGLSSFQTTANAPASGAPFSSTSAENGLSINGAGRVVLGQDVGQAGNPARITNARELQVANGANIVITDENGVVFAYFDPQGQIMQLGYDLAVTEADRMAVFGPAQGAGEGVEIKGAQRLNLISPQIFILLAPPVNPATFDILVRSTVGGPTGNRVETVTGASGSFTTTDGKTVTVVGGIITAIV